MLVLFLTLTSHGSRYNDLMQQIQHIDTILKPQHGHTHKMVTNSLKWELIFFAVTNITNNSLDYLRLKRFVLNVNIFISVIQVMTDVLFLHYVNTVRYVNGQLNVVNERIYKLSNIYVNELDKRLEAGNLSVNKFGHVIISTKLDEINEIRLVSLLESHRRLLDLIRSLNKYFGLPMLFYLASKFIAILISCNFMLMWLYPFPEKVQVPRISLCLQIASSLIVNVCSLLYLVMVCQAGTNNAAGTSIPINQLALARSVAQFEWHLITNSEVRFSACAFFSIDHTLLFKVISTVVTYLLVFIQMHN